MIAHKPFVLDSALNICYIGSVTGFLTHIMHGLDSQLTYFLCELSISPNIWFKTKFLKDICNFKFLNSLMEATKIQTLMYRYSST